MATIQLKARTTNHIAYAQTAGGFHATRYATSRGRPLNTLVTINFDRAGLPEDHVATAFRELRAKLTRSWRHAATRCPTLGTFDDIHAHENPNGRRNVHWAIHVPPSHTAWFASQVHKFLAKILRMLALDEILHIQPIKTPGNTAKYILKGVDPRFASHFHMKDWAAPQGRVTGRRFGTSRSLGRSARRKNWRRK